MKLIALLGTLLIAACLACIGAAIAWGGPGTPPAMGSINDPFKTVDWSGMPPIWRYTARDGAALAYRVYRPAAEAGGSVVLVHGSSARGSSMHVMAKAFAAAGFAAYTLDMRGHGDSGAKGQIAYVGQLEDDVEDFVKAVRPASPSTLAGFSAGGGFALRFAASDRQALFANYLLLAPFLGQDAPNYRPGSGGWVSVGVPRAMAILSLNAVGIHAFDKLPITRFALNDEAKVMLTPEYGFALAQNFRPERDYRASIRAVRQPMRVVAGLDDEAFYSDRLAGIFHAAEKDVPVTLVAGVGHIPLTLDAAPIAAAVDAVKRMTGEALQ
ncbi:alpha/beta fold hydrolase [Variovorax sp. J22R133]|uniref:alpha/beta hydrolase n=1 Tax=Variovorax brevis TaxID=3053503 RepID=UPI002576B420|nr:alpha/beta fold hydrolase [Variovorax sp. J22R133]MDM0115580.1 alpha/beta fold hydrolase [Variovorax sp. J22R133]